MDSFLRFATSLPAHQAHELSGIFGRRPKPGVNHRPESRLRNKPFAAETIRKVDRLHRAKLHTDAATFAGDRIDEEFISG